MFQNENCGIFVFGQFSFFRKGKGRAKTAIDLLDLFRYENRVVCLNTPSTDETTRHFRNC